MHFNIHKNERYDNSLKARKGKKNESILCPVSSMFLLYSFSSFFLEKEMATHSSIHAWKILWTEEPGGLQFMGSQRVGHTENKSKMVSSTPLYQEPY